MRPPGARTWARCGITPLIRVRAGGKGNVSVAGLVWDNLSVHLRAELRAFTAAQP
jgi:hypothetical protein